MLRWYPPVLLQTVLELTFVPVAGISIFALNAIVDPNTPWSIGILSGPGFSLDLIFVLAFVTSGWVLLFLGWRGAKTIFKLLLVIWHLALSIVSFLLVIGPGDLIMKGEAIGFTISYEIIGPVYALATLILAIWWTVGDFRGGTIERSVSPFQKRNRIAFLAGIIGLLVSGLGFFLNFEQSAAILGFLTAFAFREAIRPLNPSKEIQKAFSAEGSLPR